jgi:hypothetical protein
MGLFFGTGMQSEIVTMLAKTLALFLEVLGRYAVQG